MCHSEIHLCDGLNAGTLASGQPSTLNFRLNNTTDALISAMVLNNAAVTSASHTTAAIDVSAGDYFQIKWQTPIWVTNPTNVRLAAVVYIE